MSPAKPSSTAPRRKRIALVVPALADMGGVPTVALFIARAIARRPDFEVKFVSLSMSSRDPHSLLLSRPASWMRGAQTRAGVFEGYDYVHVGAVFGELEFNRLSRRQALTEVLADCDLIQVVAGVPSWACPVLGLGKPVALQVATLTVVERRSRASLDHGLVGLWRRGMTAIAARLDAAGLKGSDAVQVENPWMMDHTRAQARDGQIVSYAPPGVDTDFFRPAAPGEATPRARPYILSVGRFSDVRKNAPLLLEAYHQLTLAAPDAPDLVLAGSDGPGNAFWARAANLGIAGRIEFIALPSNEAVAALYRHAVCFALASDEEGFGMVVIEAMASAQPVVSTRSGGPDGIITEGVDGFLVDRDDAAAMAARLADLVSDQARRDRMAAAARLTVEQRYADGVAGDRYLEIYDRLLA